MSRAAVLAAAAALGLAGCQLVSGAERLVGDLRSQGLVASIGTNEDADFKGGENTTVCVGEASISVYDYPNADAAREAAAPFNDDDPLVRGEALYDNWPGRPRFWLRDDVLVMYTGEDAQVDAALRTILGQPFAEASELGARGADQSPPCF